MKNSIKSKTVKAVSIILSVILALCCMTTAFAEGDDGNGGVAPQCDGPYLAVRQ